MTQTPLQPSEGPNVSTVMLGPADVWRIIRKRLGLIIACFVVLGLGGTGGLIAWRVLAPFYTAEGVIEVEPGQGGSIAGFQGGMPTVPIQLFDEYMAAQAMAIGRYTVLDAALQKLDTKQTMFAGQDAAFRLGKEIRVAYIPRTQNISVALTGRNRDEVSAIVQAVLEEYTSNLEADRKQTEAKRQSDLRDESGQLEDELQELGRQLARLRRESGAIILDENRSEHLARLGALTQQLTFAQVALAQAEITWKRFEELHKQATEKNDLSLLLTAFSEVMTDLRRDTTVSNAAQVVSRYEQDLQTLKQRFGAQHESVRQREAALQAAQNDLESVRNDVLGRLLQEYAGTLREEYDRARETEAQLLARVTEVREAAIAVAMRAAEYREHEQTYQRKQGLLETVMNGLEQLRISAALARANVRVSQWPIPPIEHSQPRLELYIPAVAILSLLVGLGLSFALEFMDTRLRTPAQVVRQVGIPLLGSIPDIAEDERLSVDTTVALVSHTEPQSLMAEAFRHFRTSLLFASDRPVKSLLITSPNPGDGKSAAASNLSIALARSGSRVLLVEANYRRPTLGRTFDIPEAIGLSNVLVGLNSPADVIRATAIENLDVVTGGPPPPSPADLLGSQTMRRFIEEQTRNYDHVVIDGSSILVVADCHLLAEAVDAVVLVFRAGENSRGLAQRATRQVLRLKARLLGAVLNAVRATKGGYFRQAYQAYYDYSGAPPISEIDIPAAGVSRTASRPAPSPASPEGGEPPDEPDRLV